MTNTSLTDYMPCEETVIMIRIDDAVLFGDADSSTESKNNDRCLEEKLQQWKPIEVESGLIDHKENDYDKRRNMWFPRVLELGVKTDDRRAGELTDGDALMLSPVLPSKMVRVVFTGSHGEGVP